MLHFCNSRCVSWGFTFDESNPSVIYLIQSGSDRLLSPRKSFTRALFFERPSPMWNKCNLLSPHPCKFKVWQDLFMLKNFSTCSNFSGLSIISFCDTLRLSSWVLYRSFETSFVKPSVPIWLLLRSRYLRALYCTPFSSEKMLKCRASSKHPFKPNLVVLKFKETNVGTTYYRW